MKKCAKFKLVMLCVMACITLLLTACGSNEVVAEGERSETVKVSMYSIGEHVTEAGIFCYGASENSSGAFSVSEGDFGTIILTLMNEEEPDLCAVHMWTNNANKKYGMDVIVVSGKIGSSYKGTVECDKCGYFENVEGKISATDVKRFSCKCDGKNNTVGKNKKVAFIIFPFNELKIEAESKVDVEKN